MRRSFHLQPWLQVKAYFSGLDIDPDETKIIFTLLDSDCNGDIDIEEPLKGSDDVGFKVASWCLEIQGSGLGDRAQDQEGPCEE